MNVNVEMNGRLFRRPKKKVNKTSDGFHLFTYQFIYLFFVSYSLFN